jgi:hypothetical protein
MIRRIAIAVAALAFLGLLVFSLLCWRAAIASIERPTPTSFSSGINCEGRSSRRGGALFVLPRTARRSTIRWRLWCEHTIRGHLRKQYNARSENWHRCDGQSKHLPAPSARVFRETGLIFLLRSRSTRIPGCRTTTSKRFVCILNDAAAGQRDSPAHARFHFLSMFAFLQGRMEDPVL